MVNENWDEDKTLDVDKFDEKWRVRCIAARAVYDDLDTECQLKVSEMIKVVMKKVKGLKWTSALTLLLILLEYQLDPKNCENYKK